MEKKGLEKKSKIYKPRERLLDTREENMQDFYENKAVEQALSCEFCKVF